jgi:hypothetical protein
MICRRYDTPKHDLTDYSANEEVLQEIFPGQDYSNPRVKDFQKGRTSFFNLLDNTVMNCYFLIPIM